MPEKIHLVGGGTLSRFVIDIVEQQSNLEILGIYDDSLDKGEVINGISVKGKTSELNPDRDEGVVVAIGSPEARKKIIEGYLAKGFLMPAIIAPTAIISSHAEIKDACIIGPLCTVLSGSVIGKGTCILSHVNINHDVSISDFFLIGASCALANGVSLGEGAHLSIGQTIPLETTIRAWEYIA